MGQGCDCFWSHGVTFDLMILTLAYKQLGIKEPWHYSKMRDTRTLLDLAPTVNWPVNPHRHNPLWDAAVQAVGAQRAYAALGVKA